MPRLTRCFSQCDARFSECAQRSPLRSAALAEWAALQRAMRALAAAHDHETVQTILADLSQDLSHERAGVLAAVRMHGSALAQAAEYLKRDREIVLAAVRADGGALAHAAPELQEDREVLLVSKDADGAGERRVRVEAERPRSLGRAQGAPGRKVLEDVLRRRERPPRLER